MSLENYNNREISWLHFNERVLQEAADPRVPLISRLRFLGIFSSNLDEFYRVRYATIRRIVSVGKQARSELGGIRAEQLLKEITNIAIRLEHQNQEILVKLNKELEKETIFFLTEKEFSDEQRAFVRKKFTEEIAPDLFSIILKDKKTKKIDLKDSRAYLISRLDPVDKKSREGSCYGLVEIPRNNDRFIVLPAEQGKQLIVMLDDIIRCCFDKLFGMFDLKASEIHTFKITKDAELDLENDFSKSFMEKIAKSIQERTIAHPVRLEYDKGMDVRTLRFLLDLLSVQDRDSVTPSGRYMNRRDYMYFPAMGRHDLVNPDIRPLPIKGLQPDGSFFKQLEKQDFLQHTPYHSFSHTIRFLREAALDPKVKTIKITLYRVAKNSQVISALINAARNGKKVIVQIELLARFDEEANIEYAEKLQQAGIYVIAGIPGLKVHSKICAVERTEKNKHTFYGFVSTGNFNESSARMYTDVTLFTSNQHVLKEINEIFHFVEKNYDVKRFKHLIVSPHYSYNRFASMIKQEIKNAKAGKIAYIKLKMNSLTYVPLIKLLYQAGKAGVEVQLIIRGTCCLRPHEAGLSENIKAISIVDKFLEHSRLFIFANNGDEKVYFSSADWMTRNIEKRVEVTCPVYQEDIRKELIKTFTIYWHDNQKARFLSNDRLNEYRTKHHKESPLRAQTALYDYYKNV